MSKKVKRTLYHTDSLFSLDITNMKAKDIRVAVESEGLKIGSIALNSLLTREIDVIGNFEIIDEQPVL
jgi:hypothetical protein